MPPKKPCSEPGCPDPVIARGLCRVHYNAKRHTGELEMGKGKVGRKAGPVKGTQLPERWQDGPNVSWADLKELAKKRAWHILSNDQAPVIETNKVLGIILAKDDDDVDPEAQKRLEEMFGRARGLKVVPDE